MPRFNPEKLRISSQEGVLEEKELRDYKPVLTFSFRLNEKRRMALEMFLDRRKVTLEEVSKLLNNKEDFIERMLGALFIPKIEGISGEDYIKLLNNLKDDKSWGVRQVSVQILPELKLGEKILPFVEELAKDKDWRVRMEVAKILPELGLKEKILPVVEELLKDKNWNVREIAWQDKVNISGVRDIKPIDLVLKDIFLKRVIRTAEVLQIVFGFPKILSLLLKLEKLEERIISEKRILEEKESKPLKSSKIDEKIVKLLGSPRPVLATPFREEVEKIFFTISKITKELKKEFKDDFVGINIIGSISKGSYWGKKSDTDIVISAQNYQCFLKFKEMVKNSDLKSYPLDCNYHLINEKGGRFLQKPHYFFTGLFIGDRNKLSQIQEKIINEVDEKKWDKIREKIMWENIMLANAIKRFGLTSKEVKDIIMEILLFRIPPSLSEMKKIIQVKERS